MGELVVAAGLPHGLLRAGDAGDGGWRKALGSKRLPKNEAVKPRTILLS
jgi:hypothetical protein